MLLKVSQQQQKTQLGEKLELSVSLVFNFHNVHLPYYSLGLTIIPFQLEASTAKAGIPSPPHCSINLNITLR